MVYFTRRFVLTLALCYFVLLFFSPFSIAITSFGKGRANLGAFHAFSCVCLICLVVSASSSSSCLGWAAACDCGTAWTFLLHFFEEVLFCINHLFNVLLFLAIVYTTYISLDELNQTSFSIETMFRLFIRSASARRFL